MDAPRIKPTDKAIKTYYQTLSEYVNQDATHEGAVSSAFQELLHDIRRRAGWTLVPQHSITVGGKSIRPDGTLRDDFSMTRGHWEAKDTRDKLEAGDNEEDRQGLPPHEHHF